MKLKNSISVRFSEDTKERLEIISGQCGLSVADLVRKATEEYINQIKRQGGITFPINIQTNGQTALWGGDKNNGVATVRKKKKKKGGV